MNPTTNPNDAYDDIDLDQFEDFDGADIAPSRWGGTDYLSSMWGRSGFAQRDARAAVTAHGMVQTFVNAFARDGRYAVTFDPNMSTAGTNFESRKVVITPAPILDANITAEEAGLILTGLAVHEISHPRYGKGTAKAVERAFPHNWVADRLSNILDDVRIEARFAADYPGYAGVFAPTLAYVAKGSLAKNGGRLINLPLGDQVNIASAAIRYPDVADWAGIEAERDWWQSWSAKWSREDSPRRHVEAIREALRHIVAAKQNAKAEKEADQPEPVEQTDDEPTEQTPQDPQPTDQPDEDASDLDADEGDQDEAGEAAGGAGEAGDEDGDQPTQSEADEDATDEDMNAGQGAESAASGDQPDEDEKIDADAAGADSAASLDAGEDGEDELTDEELNEMSRESSERADVDMPDCAGSDSVQQAAEDQGVDTDDIDNVAENAQEAVEAARDGEDDGHGNTVDVARSLKGLIHGRLGYRTSNRVPSADAASRYVRDAIMRSRSGHTGVARYQKRGSLDNRGLHRIASNDSRLFSKRHAPDPGKYFVWVMIDCSSSMMGAPIVQAAQVAEAIAMASRSTPNTRVEVWGWSDAFRSNRYGAGVARVWADGQPTTDVRKVADLPMGGTPDTEVIGWAARAIKREARGGEQPVLIIGSDGRGNLGNDATKDAVEEARKMGVDARSVALGHTVREDAQLEMYGRDGYVAWQGSVLATAKPLARMIARLVGKAQR